MSTTATVANIRNGETLIHCITCITSYPPPYSSRMNLTLR